MVIVPLFLSVNLLPYNSCFICKLELHVIWLRYIHKGLSFLILSHFSNVLLVLLAVTVYSCHFLNWVFVYMFHTLCDICLWWYILSYSYHHSVEKINTKYPLPYKDWIFILVEVLSCFLLFQKPQKDLLVLVKSSRILLELCGTYIIV